MWNKEVFGNIDQKKRQLLDEIKFWDSNEKTHHLSNVERQMRNLAKQEYANVTSLEKIKWKQKAKVQWLREGDHNTKFFYGIASSRINNNYIHSLVDENGNYVDSSGLNNHIASFFINLYKNQGVKKPKLDGLTFPRLSTEKRKWLERPCEEGEIKNVVWSIEDDKTSGPDGFSMAFFKMCWEVVKMDVLDIVINFHDESFLDKRSNVTFISLIPKSDHASKASNYRPVSLVGSTYKIISKALACRMKVVLSDLISPHQSAFIGGKQATDEVLIANECIDAALKNGNAGILCKLDLEKAYDRVR